MDAIFARLAIAAGLGLLVGLEREWAGKEVAGVRTFPLIALFGALCAVLAEVYGGSLVVAGLVAVLALLLLGALEQRRPEVGPGVTTEVAGLVVFLVGAAVAAGYLVPALVVTGGVSVLLHAKPTLHRLTRRMGEADLRAIVRLALIGLVVWPMLPDRAFGPYDVLNPREIWTMVVLIVGISLASYIAYRLLGPRKGTLVAGIFGGLISSTASTVAYARQAHRRPGSLPTAAVLVAIASTVVFARVLLEIGLVAPALLPDALGPLLILAALLAVPSLIAFVHSRRHMDAAVPRHPPSDLRGPLVFGLLYGAVLLAVAWSSDRIGERGLYLVAMLSGLADVDAITLSTSRLVRAGEIPHSAGWRAIVIAILANLVFKAGIAGALSTPRLTARLLLLFSPALVGGTVMVLWS